MSLTGYNATDFVEYGDEIHKVEYQQLFCCNWGTVQTSEFHVLKLKDVKNAIPFSLDIPPNFGKGFFLDYQWYSPLGFSGQILNDSILNTIIKGSFAERLDAVKKEVKRTKKTEKQEK